MSLLRWRKARLFGKKTLQMPMSEKDINGNYMKLTKDETVWSLTEGHSYEIACFEHGKMYNERCLSIWACWVLNGLLMDIDFLEDVTKQEAISKLYAKSDMEGIKDKLVEWGVDEKKAEGWISPHELVEWKKSANLNKVSGVPAPGLAYLWELVCKSFADAKRNQGIVGSPLHHLGQVVGTTTESKDVASSHKYGYYMQHKGKKEFKEATIAFDNAIRPLFFAFLDVTTDNKNRVAESEQMQSDSNSKELGSPSAKKMAIREALDTEAFRASYNSGKNSYCIRRITRELFSNNSSWSPEQRKFTALEIIWHLFHLGCKHARSETISNANAYTILLQLQDAKLFCWKKGPIYSVEGSEAEQRIHAQNVDTSRAYLDALARVWNHQDSRMFRTACSKFGGPKFNKSGSSLSIGSTKGWTSDKEGLGKNQQHAVVFISSLAHELMGLKEQKMSEFIFDTLIPAYAQAFEDADSLKHRQELLLEDEWVKAATLSPDSLETMLEEAISIKRIAHFFIRETYGVSDVAVRLHSQIKDDVDFKDIVIEEGDKKHWTAVLQAMGTRREWRNVRNRLRPAMGLIRLHRWWDEWLRHYGIEDTDASNRNQYKMYEVNKGAFVTKYDKENPQIITSKYLKSRIEFAVPSRFGATLLNTALLNGSTSGLYILGKVPDGMYVKSKWIFFDGTVWRTATKEMAKLPGGEYEEVRKFRSLAYLAVNIDGKNPVCVGHGYHFHQFQQERDWLKEKGNDLSIDWLQSNLFTGDSILKTLLIHHRFMQGYRFAYEVKGESYEDKKRPQITVFLSPFFGAKNKLATEEQKSKWFFSSKMWATLIQFGLVDFDEKDNDSSKIFKGFFGFTYPKKKTQAGHGGMRLSVQEGSGETKTCLPMYQERDESGFLTDGKNAAEQTVLYSGYANGLRANIGTNRFPINIPRAIKQVLSFWLRNGEKLRIKSIWKPTLGFMGWSSMEHQLGCLNNKSFPLEARRFIEKRYSSLKISSLRELLGALGDSSSWTIEDCKFVGMRLTINASDAEKLIAEFWSAKGELFDRDDWEMPDAEKLVVEDDVEVPIK